MIEKIAIDTNILNFFGEALFDGRDYKKNDADKECLAALRVFLYFTNFYITPTVSVEYNATKNDEKRARLQSTSHNLLLEILSVNETRTRAIFQQARTVHNKERDCRIFSEALTSKIDILLTFDTDMLRLNNLNLPLKVETPAYFWERKNIPKGTPPKLRPHGSNPLCQNTSWRW